MLFFGYQITHPAGCFPQFIKFFGEQIFVLWKFVLLQKRILFFAPPPVGVACYRGKDLSYWKNELLGSNPFHFISGIIQQWFPSAVVNYSWIQLYLRNGQHATTTIRWWMSVGGCQAWKKLKSCTWLLPCGTLTLLLCLANLPSASITHWLHAAL